MRYRITHHYLTLDDDGQPVVEAETREINSVAAAWYVVQEMIEAPGGRSGTTITIVVTALDEVTI